MSECFPEPTDDAIKAEFDSILNDCASPDIVSQRQILEEAHVGFRRQWDEIGFTRDVIVRHTPDSYLGFSSRWRLAGMIDDCRGRMIISVTTDSNGHDKPSSVPVVEIDLTSDRGLDAVAKPLLTGFNRPDSRIREYAELVVEQYTTLLELAADGYLTLLDNRLTVYDQTQS